MARSVNISLSEAATKDLEEISKQLNIDKTEVLRRGLEIMKVYSDASRTEEQKPELLLRKGDTAQQLVVV
jgi:energy-converting hydrogenase A subunit M